MIAASLVTVWMAALDPGHPHADLAEAIADVATSEAPLFKGDDDRIRTAAYMTAVAWRESNFKLDALGDFGRARCAFQLHGAPKEVLTDARLCTSIALERMRSSMRSCGAENLLGIYASGKCSSEAAKRISRDRMMLARWLGAMGGES